MDINLFTAEANTSFMQGTQFVPFEKLAIADFTMKVPMKSRIASFLWMTPPPGMRQYLGHRRLAKLDQTKLLIEAKEVDAGISVMTRDIEDDQVDGYDKAFSGLGLKAAQYPEFLVVTKLANGENVQCIDGTNYYATAHNWGAGNSTLPSPFTGGLNDLTFTSASSSDAATFKAAFVLNQGNTFIKPMAYMDRKAPRLITNSGTPESQFDKQVNYVAELEAECVPGWWWQSVLVNFVNTPSLSDIFTVFDQVINQLLSFQLPAASPDDPPMYVNQGIDMNSLLGSVIVSNGLARLFAHAVGEERFGASVPGSTSGLTNNIYYNSWKIIASGYMQ